MLFERLFKTARPRVSHKVRLSLEELTPRLLLSGSGSGDPPPELPPPPPPPPGQGG